ncbi:SAICAR synthase-like protein [Terfezia boudieri ATCC MYA-4762]|uniref:Kinase n=1 Tax=Terfezia boudieri ATCC MYA-4762 TaxID=1051890 RepID=A0A3N4LS31_9PEZI|nr:SAICAR synthase-like protein [Terfezia boudieri ATCC MYA-4762]
MPETPKLAPAESTPIPAIDTSKIKAFGLAAAGHDGVMSDESGSVIIKPCTTAEVAFYEASVTSHPKFAAYMPTFFGTLQLGEPTANSIDFTPPVHNRNTNIVLSNIAYGFTSPCILDVKLGAQLWDEGASPDKRARLDKVSDNTTSRPLGFRVAGMKVYKGTGAVGSDPAIDATGYRVFDKYYGRAFTAGNVIDAFKEYFTSEISSEQVKLVVSRLLRKVSEIREVVEGQESRMYSASLLFCYEGNKDAFEVALKEEDRRKEREAKEQLDEDGEEDEEEEEIKKVEDVKLIDFAHASWTPGQGPDKNALHGLKNMERFLENLSV